MVRLGATSALALLIAAAPSLAQVTPTQVWEDLQRHGAAQGFTVTADVEDAGGTLTARNAMFASETPDGSTNLTVPQLTFTQTGDARVRVVVEGDVNLTSTFSNEDAGDAPDAAPDTAPQPGSPEGGEPAASAAEAPATMTVNGTVSAPGNETLVSGTPADMLYEYRYPEVTVRMGLPVGPDGAAVLPLTATLSGLAGTQRNVTTNGMQATFDVAATEAAMQVAGTVPPEGESKGGTVDVQVRVQNIALKGSSTVPAGQSTADGAQMSRALTAGMSVDVNAGYQALDGTFAMSGQDKSGQDQTGSGSFGSGASDMRVQLSADGMAYAGSATDARIEATLSGMPGPLGISVARTAADIAVPVLKKDNPQPVRLNYSLEGVSLADGVWALFDPTAQLPRDPASLTVDLAGAATLTGDLFDPATLQPAANSADAATPPAPPFVPDNLTVNSVALNAAGASAQIAGALDFGTDPTRPVGSLNGEFSGVNALLDKLSATGLLPAEQAMGVRMMLTMFAKPAEGESDRLSSRIEFREDGSILANGQRVR